MKENQLTASNEGLKKQLEKQEKDLEKVIQRMAELYPDFKDGIINADQYRINKSKYEQAQKELTQSINRLRSSLGKSDTDSTVTNDFIDHFKRHGNIDRLTRPLLTELIDQIAVHQDGTLDITFNFCDTFTTAQHLLNTKASIE